MLVHAESLTEELINTYFRLGQVSPLAESPQPGAVSHSHQALLCPLFLWVTAAPCSQRTGYLAGENAHAEMAGTGNAVGECVLVK